MMVDWYDVKLGVKNDKGEFETITLTGSPHEETANQIALSIETELYKHIYPGNFEVFVEERRQ